MVSIWLVVVRVYTKRGVFLVPAFFSMSVVRRQMPVVVRWMHLGVLAMGRNVLLKIGSVVLLVV
jgi:hypothetical protein